MQDEGPGPTNLRYIYSPRRRNVEFVWTNPANDYDSIRLEIEKVSCFVLAPGLGMHRALIIRLIHSLRSEPIISHKLF